MKKLLTTIVALMLVVCSLFSLTACGDTGAGGGGEGGGEGGGAHVHDYIDHVCSCGDVEKYTEGLKYKELTNGITILGFEDGVEVPDVVYIPQKINGKTVIYIGGSAFMNSTFSKIFLPEGLLEIYSDAFTNSKITSITLPASLWRIHPNAFNTTSLGSATFTVTTGWYITRHAPTSKPSGDGKDSSYFNNKITNASRLTDCDTSNKGNPQTGARYWTRFD